MAESREEEVAKALGLHIMKGGSYCSVSGIFPDGEYHSPQLKDVDFSTLEWQYLIRQRVLGLCVQCVLAFDRQYLPPYRIVVNAGSKESVKTIRADTEGEAWEEAMLWLENQKDKK